MYNIRYDQKTGRLVEAEYKATFTDETADAFKANTQQPDPGNMNSLVPMTERPRLAENWRGGSDFPASLANSAEIYFRFS